MTAAGTLRNLAAENQNKVQKHVFTKPHLSFTYSLPQAIVEAGCLIALSEQLRDSTNIPEVVLSEVSAAMAVLASDGKPFHLHFTYHLHRMLPCPAALARRQIMELYSGDFYKILIKLTESPYTEVQYNCAGVIGHLAINRECHL